MWKRLIQTATESRWDEQQFKNNLPEGYGSIDYVTCQYESTEPKFWLFRPLEDIFRLTKDLTIALKDAALETDIDILILEFDMKENLKGNMSDDISISQALMYALLTRMFSNCHVRIDDDYAPVLYVTIVPVSDVIQTNFEASQEADYILNHIKQAIVGSITNTVRWYYKCSMVLHEKIPRDVRMDGTYVLEKVAEYYESKREA